jgi:hypothetical protein
MRGWLMALVVTSLSCGAADPATDSPSGSLRDAPEQPLVATELARPWVEL